MLESWSCHRYAAAWMITSEDEDNDRRWVGKCEGGNLISTQKLSWRKASGRKFAFPPSHWTKKWENASNWKNKCGKWRKWWKFTRRMHHPAMEWKYQTNVYCLVAIHFPNFPHNSSYLWNCFYFKLFLFSFPIFFFAYIHFFFSQNNL